MSHLAGSRAALETAIANIESRFIVVGLLEQVLPVQRAITLLNVLHLTPTFHPQLDLTLYVLECLIPDYALGLPSLYNSSRVHK